jgi:hypothetical protein
MKNSIRIVGVITALLLVSMSTQAGLLRNSAPGDTVTYTAITEGLTQLGGGSFVGSYGTPGINGDELEFTDVDIEASAFSGDFVRGDARLDFFAEAHDGYHIGNVQIGESGDGTLGELVVPSGGTATTYATATATLIVDILEVDGISYSGLDGTDSGTFASFSMPLDLGVFTWGGGLEIDVEQMLIDAEYNYEFGATKIGITVDNILTANSEATTYSVIKKKGADALSITAVSVPEPASAVLLVGMTSGLMFVRRRLIS